MMCVEFELTLNLSDGRVWEKTVAERLPTLTLTTTQTDGCTRGYRAESEHPEDFFKIGYMMAEFKQLIHAR